MKHFSRLEGIPLSVCVCVDRSQRKRPPRKPLWSTHCTALSGESYMFMSVRPTQITLGVPGAKASFTPSDLKHNIKYIFLLQHSLLLSFICSHLNSSFPHVILVFPVLHHSKCPSFNLSSELQMYRDLKLSAKKIRFQHDQTFMMLPMNLGRPSLHFGK